MSNVRISATGAVGIEVEILLGAITRGKHLVNAGDYVDLTVGGNQRLVTKESSKAAATAKVAISVGADVSSEPVPAEDDLIKLGQNFIGDAEANAEVPVQGDLFDNAEDFNPEG